jgi:hypothetical protein
MTISVDDVHRWCQALARGPSDAVETASLLGFAGTPTASGDAWHVAPLPPGTTQVILLKGNSGVGAIDVNLVEPIIRSEFDRRFGEGSQAPRVGPGRRYKVAYRVAVAGAPFTIAVIAGFDGPPTTPEAPATNLVLRRDRV